MMKSQISQRNGMVVTGYSPRFMDDETYESQAKRAAVASTVGRLEQIQHRRCLLLR